MDSASQRPRSAEDHEDRRWTYFAYAAIAAIVLWQAILAFGGSLEANLAWTIDDGFYYLKVADNVAQGLGSTFDGRHATNGYHLLWLLVLVPVMFVTHDEPLAAFRATQALQLLILALTLVVVYHLSKRILSKRAAVFPVLVFAWPRILTQTNTLLESGLYFLLLALFIHRGLRVCIHDAPRPARSSVLDGLILAAAILARLDAMFILPALALTAFMERKNRRTVRHYCIVFMIGFIALALYMSWNRLAYGHALPISGRLKTTFPRAELHWEYLLRYWDFVGLTLAGGILWLRELRDRRQPTVVAIVGLAAVFNLIQIVAFMKWGVENWYFCLAVIPGGLAAAKFVDHVVCFAAERLRLSLERAYAGVAISVLLLMTLALAQSYRRHSDLIQPHYLAVAQWARSKTPPDAVFAMTDAGIFSWFSSRKTINTDGLMNNAEFMETLRRGEFETYLREQEVDYIVSYWNRTPELLHGGYGTRRVRALLRPYDLDGGGVVVREEDEVYRDRFQWRIPPARRLEPNAVLVWRLNPA